MRAVLAILVACLFGSCTNDSDRTSEDDFPEIVQTGADVLAKSGFTHLDGKRVGLIANQTTVQGGRHLVDLMQASGNVQLAAIFAPEHGFRGEAEAGQKVLSDSTTRIPVFSLYGENRAPTPEMLKGIDVLVFDIQDVGARFYTYISTMGSAMQAAAEHGLEFVVLDRPNPLGGELVEGFIRQQDAVSFVSFYPIPAVHGLTVGELASMIKGEEMLDGLNDLKLSVVEMTGWNRSMQWPDTGLEWIPTSPNIPNFETALIYPGTCLLEATPINEGRGTSTPFLVFGAPDVDAQGVIDQLRRSKLQGVTFDTLTYVPRSIPGVALTPRHLDQKLEGVRIHISDRESVKPHSIGVHVLTAIRDNYLADSLVPVINDRWLKLLSGSDSLRAGLAAGLSAESISEQWQPDVAAFKEQRSDYLLY